MDAWETLLAHSSAIPSSDSWEHLTSLCSGVGSPSSIVVYSEEGFFLEPELVFLLENAEILQTLDFHLETDLLVDLSELDFILEPALNFSLCPENC